MQDGYARVSLAQLKSDESLLGKGGVQVFCQLRYAPLADEPLSHLSDGSTTVRASFFLVEDDAIAIMASGGARDVQAFGVLARAGSEGEGDEDEVMLVVHVLVRWEGGPGVAGRAAVHRCVDEQLARSRAIAQHGFTD